MCIDRQILKNSAVSLTARVVFAQLLDHHNPTTGQCNPKRRTLAEELGLSLRTVCNILGELRKAGWIQTKRGRHCSGYVIKREVEGQGLPFSEGQGLPLKKGKGCLSAPSGPLYEPIQGEVRARAKRAAAPPPPEENLPAAAELTTERKPMGLADADPIETYFAAIDHTWRRHGRLMTAAEERQVGNLMILQKMKQRAKAGG